MKYTVLILVVILIFGAISCKKQKITEKDISKEKQEINVIDANEGTYNVNCKIGEIFTIQLEGNPSTGFMWGFDEQGFDRTMVKYEGTKEEPKNKDQNVVGAPYIYIFSFRALKAGTTETIMHYQRQWEKDPVNDKTLLVHVTITE